MKLSFSVVLFLFFLIDFAAHANDELLLIDPDSTKINEYDLKKVDKLPLFPGGINGVMNYICENVPETFWRDFRGGWGLVLFVVDTLGNVSDIQVSIVGSFRLEERIREALIKMPKWIPGKIGEANVNTRMFIPFTSCIGNWKFELLPNKASDVDFLEQSNKYFLNGTEYLVKGDYQKAADAFDTAVSLNPKNVDAHFNNGVANLKLGKIKVACKSWNKAKELGDTEVEELISQYCK
jgi:tetratricopeptide (TPR) repeat protein